MFLSVALWPSFLWARRTARIRCGTSPANRDTGLGAAESVLASPWSDFKVDARADEFRIVDSQGRGFTAALSGDWIFMAWEQPKALVPQGRLWVSDAAGLRSYLPEKGESVSYAR